MINDVTPSFSEQEKRSTKLELINGAKNNLVNTLDDLKNVVSEIETGNKSDETRAEIPDFISVLEAFESTPALLESIAEQLRKLNVQLRKNFLE